MIIYLFIRFNCNISKVAARLKILQVTDIEQQRPLDTWVELELSTEWRHFEQGNNVSVVKTRSQF